MIVFKFSDMLKLASGLRQYYDMSILRSYRSRQLARIGLLGIIALFTGTRVIEYESSSWGWVAVFAIVTALIFGPATWIIRDRVSKAQRERLSYVVTGIVLLCVPFVIGLGLVVDGLLFFIDVGVLGSVIGLAVTFLVERTVVPERFGDTAQ